MSLVGVGRVHFSTKHCGSRSIVILLVFTALLLKDKTEFDQLGVTVHLVRYYLIRLTRYWKSLLPKLGVLLPAIVPRRPAVHKWQWCTVRTCTVTPPRKHHPCTW